jgi:8-hydroxy-5-deazaflavin:NADPH oxidoreductase
MTDITIIGSGNMARGIGTRAVAAGRSLEILDRDPAKAAALAAELGAQVTSGATTDALAGEIVVLAVPFDAARELVIALGAALAGKTVIDISNPVDFSTFDSLTVAPGTSAAEELAALAAVAATGATVVKAFNTTFAGPLAAGSAAGLPLDVFIASDSDSANAVVAAFVADSGQRPIVVGPLRRARELESFQLLVMTLQVNPALDTFTWNTSLKVLV